MWVVPDVFVSYAHVDNELLPGADKGWVTNFINGLKVHLNRKLGRRERYTLWMDYGLPGHDPVTPSINTELDTTRALLLFLSTGYLESKWCRDELGSFVDRVGIDTGRIFVVELDRIDQRPAALVDLKLYQFWIEDDSGKVRMLGDPQPRADESEYYDRLEDFGRDLADKIKALQSAADQGDAGQGLAAVEPPLATIFLARVSDDLEERRAEMVRYLKQVNVGVLPEKIYRIESYAENMSADLRECDLFVQLLSERLGNRIPTFQHQAALGAGLPILQWRSLGTSPSNVQDDEHRALLEGETLISGNLVDFKAMVHERLTKEQNEEPKARDHDGMLVFVDAGKEDMGLARKAADLLAEAGIASSLPLEETSEIKPSEIRADLERNLLECDAVLVLYGDSPVVQIREHLRYCWRMRSRREAPFKSLAVCLEAREDKPDLGMRFPGMLVFDDPPPCPNSCVKRFVEALRAS